MFKTNASRRRFLTAQKQLHPGAPENLWSRYMVYCDNCGDFPDPFKLWVMR